MLAIYSRNCSRYNGFVLQAVTRSFSASAVPVQLKPSKTKFRVGNTYQRLSENEALLDRTKQYKKDHDFTLYVDVENDEIIDRVLFHLGPTFKPSVFVCHSPIPIGGGMKRFATRQKTYGSYEAIIHVIGRGGTSYKINYPIKFEANTWRKRNFTEKHPIKKLEMVEIPSMMNFGLELELTTHKSLENIHQTIEPYDWWTHYDRSIICNNDSSGCTPFELVSPVLSGEDGLSTLSRVLASFSESSLEVNRSMGFHVHIDVDQYSFEQLIKICQNFIKYEEVMDAFMPMSRRTGSAESDRYCKSNLESIGSGYSNKDRHTLLEQVYDLESLVNLMNQGGLRYHKLNLQNLITGRQPTIEFRQHSATANVEKICAWIRFCAHFCHNSARLRSPRPFRRRRTLHEKFDALFYYVIKDRALRDYYKQRMKDVAQS